MLGPNRVQVSGRSPDQAVLWGRLRAGGATRHTLSLPLQPRFTALSQYTQRYRTVTGSGLRPETR